MAGCGMLAYIRTGARTSLGSLLGFPLGAAGSPAPPGAVVLDGCSPVAH